MIFKCDHEHGGGRTTRCMHGCNDAWAPIGDPEPAAVAPPSAPPCDYAKLPAKQGYEHGPGVNNVRGYHICDECKRLMREAEKNWDAAQEAANHPVSPPETTAPTATDEDVLLLRGLAEHHYGATRELLQRTMARLACDCGAPVATSCVTCVVGDYQASHPDCAVCCVSPVASSATPTPEPTEEQAAQQAVWRKRYGSDPKQMVPASALASSQQEVATLREAINTAIGHIGAMNDRPDRVQWDELEGIQDALFASLTTEPR